MIRESLRMDSAMLQGLRPSVIRLYVEVDISKSLTGRLHIQAGHYEFYLAVEYEDIPLFCSECRVLRHEVKNCHQVGGGDAPAENLPPVKRQTRQQTC